MDYPVAELRLDEHEHCLHFLDNINIAPSKKGDYILNNMRRSHCNSTDSRAQNLDFIGEEDLIDLNEELNSIVRFNLPAYKRPSNDITWKLSVYHYP